MARWAFAGSLGLVLGALVLALAVATGLGWRALFWAFAITTVLVLLVAKGIPLGGITETAEERVPSSFRRGTAYALGQLRFPSVLRWLVLLEFSDYRSCSIATGDTDCKDRHGTEVIRVRPPELPAITKRRINRDLRLLGPQSGDTVMLHAPVSKIGWIVGGQIL
jgi:hypothetical protein